jgi:tetratricopeptide (TPR) repeat protein
VLEQRPETIRKVAEWAQLEKTAMWHSQVAKLIREKSPADALEEYQRAIERDKEFAAAHFGLAIAHGELGHYDTAIDEMQHARGQFPNEPDSAINGSVWISRWQQAAGKTDDAIETLEQELSERPNNSLTIAEYLSLTSKAGLSSRVISTLKKLGGALPEFLISDDAAPLHRLVRVSAQKTKRMDFIKKAYEAAVEKARLKDGDEPLLNIRRELATIYAENEEEEKATREYEEIFQHEEYFGKQDFSADEDAGFLSELYFTAAFSHADVSNEYAKTIEKLKRMETSEHLSDANALSPTRYYVGLFLGCLKLLQNKPDEARPYFKDRIALAMTLLEDGDVSNDIQAWEILTNTLFVSGDEVNAKAALGIMDLT